VRRANEANLIEAADAGLVRENLASVGPNCHKVTTGVLRR